MDRCRSSTAAASSLIYADPPFNTGASRSAPHALDAADPDGDRTGFGGRRYRIDAARAIVLRDSFDDYLGFLEPRLREMRRLLAADGDALPAPRLPRGPLRQAAAGRAVRPRVVPERDHLGLRLRRQAAAPLAGQARHDPGVRARPARATCSTPTPSTREPYMAPGLVTRGEGGARQAADRRLVAHDRVAHRHARRPATRPRSRRGCCGGCCRRPRGRATGASTRSPARARSARSAGELGRSFVLIDCNPEAVSVMERRLGLRASARRPA